MGQSEKLSKNNLHEISIIVGRGHGIGPIYAKRLYDEIRRLQAQLSQEIEARKKAKAEVIQMREENEKQVGAWTSAYRKMIDRAKNAEVERDQAIEKAANYEMDKHKAEAE